MRRFAGPKFAPAGLQNDIFKDYYLHSLFSRLYSRLLDKPSYLYHISRLYSLLRTMPFVHTAGRWLLLVGLILIEDRLHGLVHRLLSLLKSDRQSWQDNI